MELAKRDHQTNVLSLLTKLGSPEHVRHTYYVLLDEPRSASFSSKKILENTYSLFSARFRSLQLVKRKSDDFIIRAGLVNRECGWF